MSQCAECKGPFRDAYLHLPGFKRKESGTEYWPICATCRPKVWARYLEKHR